MRWDVDIHLFIVYLIMSVTHIIYCQMTGKLINNKLERIWKEVAMAKSQHSLGGTEKNRDKSQSG
jgi:uncharacterized membrane protein